MKLELAQRIVKHNEVMQDTIRIIKSFEEAELPVSIRFGEPRFLNYLVNEIDFKETSFNDELKQLLLQRLRDRLTLLEKQMKDMENE